MQFGGKILESFSLHLLNITICFYLKRKTSFIKCRKQAGLEHVWRYLKRVTAARGLLNIHNVLALCH